jgi:hypothetical protein
VTNEYNDLKVANEFNDLNDLNDVRVFNDLNDHKVASEIHEQHEQEYVLQLLVVITYNLLKQMVAPLL